MRKSEVPKNPNESSSARDAATADDSPQDDWFRDMPADGDKLSASANEFFAAQYDTLYVFHLVVDSVVFADRAAVLAGRALDGKESPQGLTVREIAEDSSAGLTRRLREHSQILLEMMVCRIVDGFTTYMSGVLREVMHSTPELLRSRDQIRVDYALSFPTMEALCADLIDRKVLDLSYKGFATLEEWCKSHLSVDLESSPESHDAVVEVLETRNCIVHNRSIVGEKYIKAVGEGEFQLGDSRQLSVDYLFDSCRVLFRVVRGLDRRLVRKFELPETQFDPDADRTRRLMLPSN